MGRDTDTPRYDTRPPEDAEKGHGRSISRAVAVRDETGRPRSRA